MNKKDLIDLQEDIRKRSIRQRQLGGYSADSETILYLLEWELKIVDHLIEQLPKKSKK